MAHCYAPSVCVAASHEGLDCDAMSDVTTGGGPAHCVQA